MAGRPKPFPPFPNVINPAPAPPLRVALVHDYLAQAGGAERVVVALHQAFPDAPLFTSVYDAEATLPAFGGMDVRTSFLQRVPVLKSARFHKFALPLFPLAFERLDLSGYDVVLSNTTGFAKGVITGPQTCHVCYCHTPARFAWRYAEYVEQANFGRAARLLLPLVVGRLRRWDYHVAQNRVDYFLANSHNIAQRVEKFYGREANVLYPPVETGRFHVEPNPRADYFLIVSRLLAYKRVDLAVTAMTRLGLPLKVVGGGPEAQRLQSIAGPTVEFLGRRSDEEVADLLAHCRAFLFPGEEDFGIAPLEALASGRPVIAFGAGGALETVIAGETGLFFADPTPESLMDAVRRLDDLEIRPAAIRAHAETFDTAAFVDQVRALVTARFAEHRAEHSA